VTLWGRVVEANRSGPAEESVSFRIASALTVVIAIGACWSQGELRPAVAILTMAATVVGNLVSYWRRERPWPVVKPILAICVVGGFVWFIVTVTARASPGDIATVEGPLATLFAWVLSTHAFDVPARRDVAYSLAGSAALMAVAAAQTVDFSLAGYVVAWVGCGLWGLVSMWKSMAGAGGVPWVSLGVAGLVAGVLTVVFVAVLPAPHLSSLGFPSSGDGSSVGGPTTLTGGASALPAHAVAPDGPALVGGYLGFATSLDTAARVSLGTQTVMRVRASRPSFWVGQTYDQWNGRSWTQSAPAPRSQGSGVRTLASGSPFAVPIDVDQQTVLASTTDVQTFYLAQSGSGPNVVFHADNAEQIYLQSPHLLVTGNDTIVSPRSLGAGTVYTVVSADTTATAAQLRQSTLPPPPGVEPPTLPSTEQARDTQLSGADPRVTALAHQITAGLDHPGDPATYDKVQAIETWMSSHIHYSTAIPALAPGQNAVDAFLFGSRIGYCEQISTATTVMLRSLGIPAREAVGYVPGSYNPITDLYNVAANDAHAWVQVWFPGYGWQNFDPTANVPLTNPSPGSIIARTAASALGHLPWIPIGLVVVAGAGVVAWRRRRAVRPPTWAHQVAADLERAGRRVGIRRRGSETLGAYCGRLARAAPERAPGLTAAAVLVERFAYGGMEPSADQIAEVVGFARRLRLPLPAQARETASASSNDAPAPSRGR
jgi:transglutaminase-like putative cysteine protease